MKLFTKSIGNSALIMATWYKRERNIDDSGSLPTLSGREAADDCTQQSYADVSKGDLDLSAPPKPNHTCIVCWRTLGQELYAAKCITCWNFACEEHYSDTTQGPVCDNCFYVDSQQCKKCHVEVVDSPQHVKCMVVSDDLCELRVSLLNISACIGRARTECK